MIFQDRSMLNTAMASRQLAMAEWHQKYENQTICELVSCIALFHWLNECQQFMTSSFKFP